MTMHEETRRAEKVEREPLNMDKTAIAASIADIVIHA